MTCGHLLESGLVVDGSGAPGRPGDVLLIDDRIAAVGERLREQLPDGVSLRDLQRIDCEGLVIAPGFIDSHTHDDAIVLSHPHMLPKVSQGITTVIAGNCGISLVPLRTDDPKPPLNLLGNDSFKHARIADYRAAFADAEPAVNVALLIGHTTLRFVAMPDLRRAATPLELDRMCELLDQCLHDGAIGFSSGLFYEPAYAAPANEVLRLAQVVARHGGVYATHLRDEMRTVIEALHEAGDTAFAGGVPLVISHHKCAGPANWGRTLETLPLIDEMAKRQPIAMDAYPYVAGSTVLREDLVDGVIDVLVTGSVPHPEMSGRLLSSTGIRTRGCGARSRACSRATGASGNCFRSSKPCTR